MPRAKVYGFIACIFSVIAGYLFVENALLSTILNIENLSTLSFSTYYAIAIPIGLVALFLLGAGFWIGWTILTIKVVPPMPDIVEKKDYSKIKAFALCLLTLSLAVFFIYGVYVRSYWALAIPAATVTLVILGMIFWVGIAIITTRKTLPEGNQ